MGLTPEEALLQREKRAKRFHSPLNRTEEEDGYQKVDEDIASSVIDKIKKSNETLSGMASLHTKINIFLCYRKSFTVQC